MNWGDALDWATDDCYTVKDRKPLIPSLMTMYKVISLGFRYIAWDELCVIPQLLAYITEILP